MGVWGSPQTVSGSAQGAAGTVAARFFLENGEQKHAKDFEAAKEQWSNGAMQDRQSWSER